MTFLQKCVLLTLSLDVIFDAIYCLQLALLLEVNWEWVNKANLWLVNLN